MRIELFYIHAVPGCSGVGPNFRQLQLHPHFNFNSQGARSCISSSALCPKLAMQPDAEVEDTVLEMLKEYRDHYELRKSPWICTRSEIPSQNKSKHVLDITISICYVLWFGYLVGILRGSTTQREWSRKRRSARPSSSERSTKKTNCCWGFSIS